MHNYCASRRVLECCSIKSVVQKTYLMPASCLQWGHPFQKQFVFVGNPTCGFSNNGKGMRTVSAKEAYIACCRFDHFRPPGNIFEPN